jgi:hypothetical protein
MQQKWDLGHISLILHVIKTYKTTCKRITGNKRAAVKLTKEQNIDRKYVKAFRIHGALNL